MKGAATLDVGATVHGRTIAELIDAANVALKSLRPGRRRADRKTQHGREGDVVAE